MMAVRTLWVTGADGWTTTALSGGEGKAETMTTADGNGDGG
jgi:hypothetical protein